MFSYLAIAAGFAAYGAPTNYDALDAYTARILEDVREAGDVLREPELMQAPNFPSDLVLERCYPREERAVRMSNGAVIRYNGYDCIMEVWPNAEPTYRTSGFFRHNGFDWEYYGPVQEVNVPPPSQFKSSGPRGQMITKPGSAAYDGDPKHPLNDGYDPYSSLFEDYERGREEF